MLFFDLYSLTRSKDGRTGFWLLHAKSCKLQAIDMRALVTGAAGFIGSHMCERLVREGHEVVGVDCFTDYYSRAIKDINAADVRAAGVVIHERDLAVDDLSELVQGVEAVVHFAAQPGISATVPFDHYERNNIIATKRLIDATQATGTLKGFVNIATSSIYGKHATDNEEAAPKPTSNYGVTKLAAEQLVLARQRDQGFPGLSIRPFSVCGERERPEKLYHKLAAAILNDEEFPLFEGSRNHIRSFTYVGDIVDGCMLALNKLDVAVGEIFNIGTDKTNTVDEGLEIIQDIIGKKAKFKMLPRRPGDQQETAADIEKARRILGYEPKTSFREALEREVAWYKDKVHGKV